MPSAHPGDPDLSPALAVYQMPALAAVGQAVGNFYLILCVGLLVTGFGLAFLLGSSPWAAKVVGCVLVVLGGVVIIQGGRAAIKSVPQRRALRVVVSPDGLEQREHGTVRVSHRWDEIAAVRSHTHGTSINGVFIVTGVTYTVRLVDGRVWEPGKGRDPSCFSEGPKLPRRQLQQIHATIRQQLRARLLPPRRQQYYAGNPVSFGDLTMQSHNVTMRGLKISLTTVKRFEVDDYRQLHVRRWSGGTMKLGSVDEIENFFLFWALVTEVLPDMHSTGSGRTKRRDAPSSTVPPDHQVPVTSGIHKPGEGGEPPRLDEQVALPPPECWRV